MRGTGRFEIARFDITCKFNAEPQGIVFFGDVHKYAPGHCDKAWSEFKEKYTGRPNTWFIGMGDFTDLMSASERAGYSSWVKHGSTEKTIEDWYAKLAEDFYKECEFMRGKLIGVIEGNHHYRFCDGTTTGMRFAQYMKCNYLGDCALICVNFHRPGNARGSHSLHIAVHHGVGSGRTTGSMFNSLDHMSNCFEGCSIYAMGDNHQRGGVPTQKLRIVGGVGNVPLQVRDNEVMLVRTGSFLRAYAKGQSDYVVDKMMKPANLGSVRVDVVPVRKRFKGREEFDFKMEVVA